MASQVTSGHPNYTTRGKLFPDDERLPYSITTSRVESYLQEKVNIVAARSGMKDSVTIRLYSSNIGKNFMPFFITLSLNALVDGGDKKRDDDILEIFEPKANDRTTKLRPEFFNLFKAYVYNREDVQAFYSDNWKRMAGVPTRHSVDALKRYASPRIAKFNGISVVIFMIDPIRAFHDMLVMEDDKRAFRVDIKKVDKIRSGEFKYSVTREIQKGKGKKNDDIGDIIARNIQGPRH